MIGKDLREGVRAFLLTLGTLIIFAMVLLGLAGVIVGLAGCGEDLPHRHYYYKTREGNFVFTRIRRPVGNDRLWKNVKWEEHREECDRHYEVWICDTTRCRRYGENPDYWGQVLVIE